MEKIPSAREWRELALHLERKTPSHGNQEQWDAMAPKYARKPKRSGYIAQFLDSLELLPGESVFDMGCGPGVLSVPLAKADHEVFAVDFSEGMLMGFLHRAVHVKPEEEERFERFVSEHMEEAPGGGAQLDYEQNVRWAVISWDVPTSDGNEQ